LIVYYFVKMILMYKKMRYKKSIFIKIKKAD
jgi:hypothetical protein